MRELISQEVIGISWLFSRTPNNDFRTTITSTFYNEIKERLKHLEGTFPKRMVNNLSGPPLFPMYLKGNKTKSDVISDVFDQIIETVVLLN